MMSVYQIIKQLESTSSTNEKQTILEQYKDNELLRECFRLMLDDTLFYIKEIDEPQFRTTLLHEQVELLTLKEAIRELESLTNRTYTGNEANLFLNALLNSVSLEDGDVLIRIIKKDPNCGVSDKTVNKVWKGLIKTTPYMRCDGDLDKISYPCLAQVKSDGMFCNIICANDKVTILSRNGKYLDFDGILEDIFDRLSVDNLVLHGELLVMDNGKVLPRKTGNGLLMSVQKYYSTRETLVDKLAKAKTATQFNKIQMDLHVLNEKIDNIRKNTVVNLWDCVDYSNWKNGFSEQLCWERFDITKEIVDLLNSSKVNLIDFRYVDSLKEISEYYEEVIINGEEGLVIKNPNGPWESGNSKNLIKMKAEEECDLVCYDTIPHKKNPSLIGALCCMSGDGKLRVDVGSGLTDEDRAKGKDFYIDKIMTVRYNEKIKNKNGEYSLFLPRLVEIDRQDHAVDFFENIK